MIASAFNFEPREFFDAPAEAEATPEVSFSSRRRRRAPGAAPRAAAPRSELRLAPALLAARRAGGAAACPPPRPPASADVTDADVKLRLAPDAACSSPSTSPSTTRATSRPPTATSRCCNGRDRSPTSASARAAARYQPGGCTVLGCPTQTGRFGVARSRAAAASGSSGTTRRATRAAPSPSRYRVDGAARSPTTTCSTSTGRSGATSGTSTSTSLTATLQRPGPRPGDDPLYRGLGPARATSRATTSASPGSPGSRPTTSATAPVRRDAGHGSAHAGPGRRGAARSRTRARACRRSSPRSRTHDDDYNSPSTGPSAGSPTTRCCWSLLARGRRPRRCSSLLALHGARAPDLDVPKHLPEPPDDARPALAYGLAHEGGDSTDTVLATLLDLVDRGYYEARPGDDRGREARPRARRRSEAPRRRSSSRHEKEVLDFFDELLEGDTVPMSEMRDRIPEHTRRLARPLGVDDRALELRRRGPARLGPQPERPSAG